MTKRKHAELGINFANEFILFVVVIVWIDAWRSWGDVYDPAVEFAHADMSSD